MDVALLLARLLLAAVFVVAGLAKLADREGSREALVGFGVPEPLARPFGVVLPAAELVVAVALIPVAWAWWGAVGAAVLLALFVAGIARSMIRGDAPDCHCFGQIHSEPAGWRTLIRNAILTGIAGFVIVAGADDAGASAVRWFTALSGGEQASLALGAIALMLLLGEGSLLVNLMRQNGRMLARLESLEGILQPGGAEAPTPAIPSGPGLPLGAPAPSFRLSGLHGETLTLDALRAPGKPVMLLFSDPNCGPCNALLPEIGRWQREHAGQLTVALISRGKPEANLEKVGKHGVTTTLLQENREVAAAYEASGTPSAVIVKPDGTIGSYVAAGSGAITNLLEQIISGRAQAATLPLAGRVPARPVAPGSANGGASAPNRSGNSHAAPASRPPASPLPVGARPAPAINLPDLDGHQVRLESYRGANTMLLFWNPGCGFCQRMVDDIKNWEAHLPANAPKLLVISTGTADANRAQGIRSTMLLDAGFATGRLFGAGGTPSAVLIDANGNLASGVAVGAPAVLDMAYNRAVPPTLEGQPARGNGAAQEQGQRQAPRERLAPLAARVGQKAPDLKLPDLDGAMVDLADFRGSSTLLLFWNPGCGFCRRMLDDLKALENNPLANAPKLLVVSTGAADANREMGLRATMLLDQNFTVGRTFGANGTPSAVLIDAKGDIASPVAVGAPNVLALAGVAESATA